LPLAERNIAEKESRARAQRLQELADKLKQLINVQFPEDPAGPISQEIIQKMDSLLAASAQEGQS
jgi:hypothetical protein